MQESLEQLYKLDILDRAGFTTFWGSTDPLLLEFLRYKHYLDIDEMIPQNAEAKLRQELNKLQGEMNRQAGHFSEIIVAGVLRNYDGRTLDSEPYFTLPGSVTLPRMETILRREGVVKSGIPHEIDVVGEYKLHNQQEGNAALGVWLVSVRHQLKKMGEGEIEAFMRDAAAFQAEKGYGAVTRWYFSKAGFTPDAQERLRAEGIYCSELEQFNRLSALFGLLPLRMGV